jgi:hypothetical protein
MRASGQTRMRQWLQDGVIHSPVSSYRTFLIIACVKMDFHSSSGET